MSIQSEINRIRGNVNASLREVAKKGVEVQESDGSNELPGLIASIPNANKGNAIIYTGSYAGTGTYGSSNPTTITIPESSGITKLKFIYIYQDNYWTMLSLNQLYAATYYRSGDNVNLIAYQIKSTMSGRTITFFHSASATKQLNESGKTYHFFAFGE